MTQPKNKRTIQTAPSMGKNSHAWEQAKASAREGKKVSIVDGGEGVFVLTYEKCEKVLFIVDEFSAIPTANEYLNKALDKTR